MNRYECFEFLAPLIKDELVLGSLSGQRVEWGHLCTPRGKLVGGLHGSGVGDRHRLGFGPAASKGPCV